MFETIQIILSLLNFAIAFTFDTIVLRKIYDTINNKYQSLINVEENIPTV